MGACEVDKEQTVLLSCGGRSVAVTVLLRLNAIYMPLILLTSVGLGVLLKIKRLAALILAAAAVLSACGDGGEDYTEAPTASATQITTPSAEATIPSESTAPSTEATEPSETTAPSTETTTPSTEATEPSETTAPSTEATEPSTEPVELH